MEVGLSEVEPIEEHIWDRTPIPRQVLPDDLEVMAPGAELASALANIDRNALNGYEVVVVLEARAPSDRFDAGRTVCRHDGSVLLPARRSIRASTTGPKGWMCSPPMRSASC